MYKKIKLFFEPSIFFIPTAFFVITGFPELAHDCFDSTGKLTEITVRSNIFFFGIHRGDVYVVDL